MGLFDFIFSSKKKEQERIRLEAEKRRQRLEQERIARERERRLEENRRKEQERQARLKAERDKINNYNSSEFLNPYVDRAISTYESGNIGQLQNELDQLVSLLNKPGSGRFITTFSRKDRLCEVFNLCLQYDWMNDSDIREVWAENAFYCISEYFKIANNQQDYFAAALDLFLTCSYGENSLKPKFNDILRKARIHPFHSSIFTQKEYEGGAAYILREFLFFSATIISPIVKSHPNILSSSVRLAYESAKTDFEFATISPEEIIKKMSFISAIIGSILDSM